jgi:WhiB family transcriptional regulator, redox-sensing transcriptional regulator
VTTVEGGVVEDDWRMKAACQPFDSELFFPDRSAYRNNEIAQAKSVCRGCPVREDCLKAALDGREKVGIWGGLTPEERAKLQRRNRRARASAAAAASVAEERAEAASPIMEAGYPTREQIRRGVSEGWLRIDPARRYAAQQA